MLKQNKRKMEENIFKIKFCESKKIFINIYESQNTAIYILAVF